MWTCPGAASHIGNNHFIHIWKLFSLPVSTSKADSFNPQAIRYMFKQRSFSVSFFLSRHMKTRFAVFNRADLFTLISSWWLNTILIYCDKNQQQQSHAVRREKGKNHKLKPNCSVVSTKAMSLFSKTHTKNVRTQIRQYAPRGPSLTQLSRQKNISCLQACSRHLSWAADRSNSTESVADQHHTVPDLCCSPAVNICSVLLEAAKAASDLHSTAWPTDILIK